MLPEVPRVCSFWGREASASGHGATRIGKVEIRVRFVVVLLLRKQLAAGMMDQEQGSKEDDEQDNGGSGDDHHEVGVFAAARRDVGGGGVGHTRWDAGDAVQAHSTRSLCDLASEQAPRCAQKPMLWAEALGHG